MLIYRAVNTINGKSYVGKTEKTFDERKSDHLNKAKRDKGFAFHAAIRKYGEESFVWEVIDDTISDEVLLNQKEEHYIALYESFGLKGYNMTKGGEGQKGWVPSAETRALWSKQRKGKPSPNAGTAQPKKRKSAEEKAQTQKLTNEKRSKSLQGRTPWNAGMSGSYGYTTYKVYFKDGTVKEDTRLNLGLPKQTIDTMFRDKCGSRKYNIMKIERLS